MTNVRPQPQGRRTGVVVATSDFRNVHFFPHSQMYAIEAVVFSRMRVLNRRPLPPLIPTFPVYHIYVPRRDTRKAGAPATGYRMGVL
jgi:hypothetical protein